MFIFFLVLILLLLIFLVFTLSIELILLKRQINQKNTQKTVENSSKKVFWEEKSFSTIKSVLPEKDEKQTLSVGVSSKMPIWNPYKENQAQYPIVPILKIDSEIQNLEIDYLSNWLNKSMNGFYLSSYEILPNFLFNLVVLDIESNKNQLFIGFFFTSLNIVVQFSIDSKADVQSQERLQDVLIDFFKKFNSMSQKIETNLKKDKEEEKISATIPLLVGYNINNFDLPALDCFIGCKGTTGNSVLKTRKYIEELLSGIDKKDFSSFSPLLSKFFMFDVFWQTGNRLREWINPLNESDLFPQLQPKNWKNGNFPRFTGTKLVQWSDYNSNDLKAAYYLCLFENNFLNFFFPRFRLFLQNPGENSLIELLRKRFLK